VAAAKPVSVTFRNSVRIADTAVDQNGQQFTITGMSGVAYRGPLATPPEPPGSHEFIAVMDNSNKLVRLRVTLGADGAITGVGVLGGITLAESRDFEGVAVAPGGLDVILSEEGTPAVREYALADGAVVGAFGTPQVFGARRGNYGWESLTLRRVNAAVSEVWTANEEALTVDGPLSTQAAGTVVRVQRYSLIDGVATPTHQFAYNVDAWHGSSISGARSGVSDLVAMPDGELLTLERSFAFNLGGFFRTRIYQVGFVAAAGPATDVSEVPSLAGATYTALSKRLLWQGNQANLEGLCVGPSLGDRRWAMIGVVDDADPISLNTVVGFEVREPVPQATTAE
jgi:hypothetical protein